MEHRRLILFIVLSIGLLMANIAIQSHFRAKQDLELAKQKEQAGDKKDGDKKEADCAGKAPGEADKAHGDVEKVADNQKPGEIQKHGENNPAVEAAAEEPEPAEQWFTLGSADPNENKNPYRLLATITNQGAAVERIELSSARYRDMEDRSGYMGHLAAQDTPQGVKINVVGAGTPAAEAKLQVGDIIVQCDGQAIDDAQSLVRAMIPTRPEQKIELTIKREGREQQVSVTLNRRPLEVVRPEVFTDKMETPKPLDVVSGNEHNPFSFLLTLHQVDDKKLIDEKKPDDDKKLGAGPPSYLDAELDGVKLRSVHWQGKQVDPDTVEFTRSLPKLNLEIVKRYSIVKIDGDKPAYHLFLDVEVRNVGQTPRKVAYQLDGPTGLPTEGWWYQSRPSRNWQGIMPAPSGVRDVGLMLHGKEPALNSPMEIAKGNLDPPYRQEDPESLLVYAGVDAQYFASALLPVPQKDRKPWLAQIKPILVGRIPEDARYKTLGDVSCRLVSTPQTLEPGGAPLRNSYTIFAGPKKPDLLSQYPLNGNPDDPSNLSELVYYGWPIWAMVARPMTHILQFFYSIVGNYGVAIVMLTVLVRGCMFPLSRKQALGAQKMQELKPEMDRINEKYKNKPEDKTRAMQELWRKHNYNPMSGCLVAFLQLPIFIGLYRSLMINVELRQAPLLGNAVHWCSNLAAPDMLARWADWPFMPTFLTAYKGFMSLGPYLNILPIFTVGLFIIQQQMFMPPATDEQTQMQQKMMKYMMIFIGYMFYTVPSGLCLYIIASSLWGIAEKKLLPKPQPRNVPLATGATARLSSSTDGNGTARRDRKKQRGGK